jgi:iron complex outermembrane receptor protein
MPMSDRIPSARRLALSFSSLAAIVVAQPAFAQSTAATDQAQPNAADTQGGIEDILVTAQFRGQNLQDTPLAITAVSGETLEARSQTQITEIASFAPNVNLTSANSSFGSAVQAYIRGIGQQDSSAALEPGVGIYIDDIYYGATFGAVFDLSDLERVEVLRGPQGTLAGKNSVGGAIKLFSQKPDGAGGGYIEATGGSFTRIDVRAGANFTLADGLYARVSAITKHRQGYLKRLDFGCVNPTGGLPASPTSGEGCEIGTEGGQDLTAARLALRYAPEGSPLEINLIGDITEDSSESTPLKLISANSPAVRSYDAANPFGGVPLDGRFLTGAESYTNYATYRNGGNYTALGFLPYQVAPGSFVTEPQSSVRSWGLSGTIDYDLGGGFALKSITAYRSADGTSSADLDSSPLDAELIVQRLVHEQFTQEVRLSGAVGDFADFTVGGYYYRGDDLIQNHIEIPGNILDFLSYDPVETTSKSVFAHAEFHLTDTLNIVAGLRYTDDKKTYTFSRRNTDGTIPAGIPFNVNFLLAGLEGQSATYTGDRLDYRIGANFHVTPDVMVYAQVSTGFKGGGVNPRPFNPGQVRTFGPEKLTAYEAGIKADLFDRRVRLNTAVFYNDYQDIQVTLLACPDAPCASPANAGNADVKGVEAELTIEPVDGLTIDGTLGYIDFEYTYINPATGIALSAVTPFTNEWQLSGGIQYVADLGTSGKIIPRLDWAYQSEFFYNADNSPGSLVEGRSLFNARITYETEDRDWSLSAGVTNLFDKFYYATKFDNSNLFGVVQGVPGRPREWSLTLKRRF